MKLLIYIKIECVKLKDSMTFDDKGDIDSYLKDLDDNFRDILDEEESQGEAHKNQKTEKSAASIGQTLLNRGLISPDQLEVALKQHRNDDNKKSLDYILVELGFITEEAISSILSESSGVETLDLKISTLDVDLIRKIPKKVAQQYKIIPISFQDNVLRVATVDVFNILALDQLRRFFPKNTRILPLYANEFHIAEVIDQYYEYEMKIDGILKEIESGDVSITGAEEGYINPTVRLVDAILLDAIKYDASDIHLEPETCFVRLRYRIDGKLSQILTFHIDYWPAIVVRVKIISGMNIAETRNPQDGRLSYIVGGRKVDFRISTLPTVHGENIVLRILDRSKSLLNISNIGFSSHNFNIVQKALRRPEGIVIVTGPTGSGKTTSLYAVLNQINSMQVNIKTLEEPVEYELPIIRQSAVQEGTSMNFVTGIRSIMRQDPDIIFIGEVRDEETATMAIRAAMTGHQVFTTLHTNDAIGTFARLADIGIPHGLIAGNIIGILSQRLLRRLCHKCREKVHPTPLEQKILGIGPSDIIFKHKGCDSCRHTGYKGRIAVHEVLLVDDDIDDLISAKAPRRAMAKMALEKGFQPIKMDGIEKVLQGVTDFQEFADKINITEYL